MSSKVHGRERGRGRTAVRASVLVGLLCVLLLVGLGYAVWELRGIAANRTAGDPATGVYQQDPERADRTASAVLDGIVREDPEPPRDGKAFADGGARTDWRSAGWQPSDPLEARPAPAEPAIGALFSPGTDGDPDHHCSGVVVHSPGGDLIVTAAHCVYGGGFRTNLAFAPGYRDGVAPYGIWVPTRIDVDPRWTEDQDPDHDIAFIRLRRPGYPGQRLEDVTGSQTIAFRPELPAPARLVGYPNASEQPLECRNTAVADGPTQLRLDCADVPNGTSGGPVLTDGRTLIGVIGGRDGGGDEETSYSSYFGDDARALYERTTTSP
ncbi:serine protease [Streptomyces sp. NBC_01310]|uniref:trypsin-like serine peptidase n=1 Tax=Streptomyces sp. NBC_01310 TaxID=2903820 RepID=UPI0035B5E01D|nr:serine protease [Streptomyces sp. NBC_01310]